MDAGEELDKFQTVSLLEGNWPKSLKSGRQQISPGGVQLVVK